ncbi:hypothetical protein JX266_012096 [Neoarthrinium moseri]|nr:hypothetical protein JX266_012096 [Neoarthrinium moseri]
MESLPSEVLVAIAAQLPTSADICQLRLVNRHFACAGFWVLFQRVHVLNTLNCLDQFKELDRSPRGSIRTVRHLTLHFGSWPTFSSRREWQSHPLLLRPQYGCEDDEAFKNYRRFIRDEASRDFDSDVVRFRGLLEMLPNLRSLSISEVNARRPAPLANAHYNQLKKHIRIVPYFQAPSEAVVSRVLCSVNVMNRLSNLTFEGYLNPNTAVNGMDFPGIRHLKIDCLLVDSTLAHHAVKFLRSFPNIVELDVRLDSMGPPSWRKLSLKELQWPRLQHVHLQDIWTTEDEFFDFIDRHKLEYLHLRNAVLAQGCWKRFFTRLWKSGKYIKIAGDDATQEQTQDSTGMSDLDQIMRTTDTTGVKNALLALQQAWQAFEDEMKLAQSNGGRWVGAHLSTEDCRLISTMVPRLISPELGQDLLLLINSYTNKRKAQDTETYDGGQPPKKRQLRSFAEMMDEMPLPKGPASKRKIPDTELDEAQLQRKRQLRGILGMTNGTSQPGITTSKRKLQDTAMDESSRPQKQRQLRSFAEMMDEMFLSKRPANKRKLQDMEGNEADLAHEKSQQHGIAESTTNEFSESSQRPLKSEEPDSKMMRAALYELPEWQSKEKKRG